MVFMRNHGWTLTRDHRAFADRTIGFLSEDPIGNTVVLTIADRLRHDSRHRAGPEDGYGWWTDAATGRVRAAFAAQPPNALTLSADMPEAAAADLVAAWLADGRPGPAGVFGVLETAERVAADFAQRTGGGYRVRPKQSMRLFSFDEPTPPDPGPPGTARLAALDDLGLVTRWDRAFAEDCGLPPGPDVAGFARWKIQMRLQLLWTVDGRTVAMAAHTVPVARSARINGVYTPPEERRKGYASGLTWALSRLAEERGARHVLLHTDLSNPTSNGVYQRLGYRPVHDTTEYELTEKPIG